MLRAAKKFDFLFVVMIGSPGMLYSQATQVAFTEQVKRHGQPENVALPVEDAKALIPAERLEQQLVEAKKELEDREQEKLKTAEANP